MLVPIFGTLVSGLIEPTVAFSIGKEVTFGGQISIVGAILKDGGKGKGVTVTSGIPNNFFQRNGNALPPS